MNIRTLEKNLERIRNVKLEKLRTECLHFVKVSIDNPSEPDGYPRQHIGAEPSSAPTPIKDPDEADLNPVENAGDPNRRRVRDEIDMKANAAYQNIATAADALELAMAKVIEARNLQAQVLTEPRPECWVLRQRADVFKEAAHKTDFATVLERPLDEPRWVCAWVYKFTRENKVLPTREQCRQHARGERVMMAA